MRAAGLPLAALACGFLDVSGRWDPSLAFVLAGAVVTAFVGVRSARFLKRPVLAARYEWPEGAGIDGRLVVGSAMFGVGWGLSGLCPGPAIADLTLGVPAFVVFAVAMVGGMLLHGAFEAVGARSVAREGR